jgi:DNA-binding MltR family transcriptional regulator
MTKPEFRQPSKSVRLRKPPSRSLDEKLTEEERAAFYDHSSDRAMAIVVGALIENHLTALLRLLMRRDEAIASEMFRPTGPLGPFGTKIRIAYMLRTVSLEAYEDLIKFSKIRNKFGHDLSVIFFDDAQISAWVRQMHLYTSSKSQPARMRPQRQSTALRRKLRKMR